MEKFLYELTIIRNIHNKEIIIFKDEKSLLEYFERFIKNNKHIEVVSYFKCMWSFDNILEHTGFIKILIDNR
jgi:hypothetical protein